MGSSAERPSLGRPNTIRIHEPGRGAVRLAPCCSARTLLRQVLILSEGLASPCSDELATSRCSCAIARRGDGSPPACGVWSAARKGAPGAIRPLRDLVPFLEDCVNSARRRYARKAGPSPALMLGLAVCFLFPCHRRRRSVGSRRETSQYSASRAPSADASEGRMAMGDAP